MKVNGILERNGRGVVTIEADTTVEQAIGIMKQQAVAALVVSPDGLSVEGLVCERELIRALKSRGAGPLMEATVGSIMRRNVPTCHPGEDLRRVMTRMCLRRVHHMPVIGPHGLCGVVSMADILRRRLDEARRRALPVHGAAPLPC